VTASLALSKYMGGPGLERELALCYLGVQFVAGLCCGLCFVSVFFDSFTLGPGVGFSWLSAGVCEMLYSALLCFVVLNTTAARKHSAEGNHFYGMAIGAMALAGTYAAGSVSGGLLNPAITIGIDVAGAGSGFGKSLVFALCQLLGGVLASWLYRLVRPEDFGFVRTYKNSLICEFLGAFALVFTIGMTVLSGTPMAVLAIAASLTAMVYAVADVSGAHFNPAVTAAIYISGRDLELTPKLAAYYVAAQLAGGISASGLYTAIHNGAFFMLGPQKGFNLSAIAVAEMFFTMLLCYVFLGVAVSIRTKSSQLFGLAIGLCFVVGGFSVGKISGACLNPAVSIAISVTNGGFWHLMTGLRYSVFEVLGGVAAACFFRITHAADLVRDEKSPLNV